MTNESFENSDFIYNILKCARIPGGCYGIELGLQYDHGQGALSSKVCVKGEDYVHFQGLVSIIVSPYVIPFSKQV